MAPLWHEKNQSHIQCGKCPGCVKKRQSNWSFRLIKEGERSLSSYFVTLTYDTTTVPRTKNGFMTLSKTDVQAFIKKLRKKHEKHDYARNYPIRYYAAGEYGDSRRRPHYHIILFNSNYQDITDAWTTEKGAAKGTIYFGTVNGASIGYTLKYISKPRTIPLHANDDRAKEFSLMSKKLGANYLTKNMIGWHLADLDTRYYLPMPGGDKAPMSKYYKEKIYNSETFGHIKGVLEKLTIDKENMRRKMYGSRYNHVTAQAHMAAFRKMYHNSKTKTPKF